MSLSTFPTSVDSFIQHTEITPADITNVQSYQQLITTPNLTPAQQTTLTQLTNDLRDKLFISDDINHLQDAITATQNFFLNSVNGYITNAQNSFNATLQQFTYMGNYSPTVTYNNWNVVSYNNQSYLCIANNTVGQVPTNKAYWSLIAAQGAQGEQGVQGAALAFVGTYNSASTYQENQLVSYNGSTYVCLQNNTTNQVPTNATYWSVFVTPAPVVQATAPTAAQTNELWIDSLPVMHYYNGTSWVALSAASINDGTTNIVPSNIGSLASLETHDNSSIVNAINELSIRNWMGV